MQVQRFFLPPEGIDTVRGLVVCKDPQLINQIRHVLRLKVSSEIIVLNGIGDLFHCILTSVLKEKIEARIIGQEYIVPQSQLRVSLALPLLRGGRFEWALEKLTELGVDTILPVVCDRTTIKLPATDSESKKLLHWQSITREAAEQCERPTIPNIVKPQKLTQVLGIINSNQGGFYTFPVICTERIEAPSLGQWLSTHNINSSQSSHIFIAVGPEGGLSEVEKKLALDNKWHMVSLGKTILRTETAAIYVLAQIRSLFDR